MQLNAQNGATDVNAVFAAALEAAASRASRRVTEVIMAARLATALHMRHAAEHAMAPDSPLAPDDSRPALERAVAAGAVSLRPGGQR